MFEERHDAAGSFDVTISGDAPDELRFPDWDVDTDHDYRLFSWLVITPSRIHDPGLTASTLWAASQFTGVVREFTVDMDGTVTLGGASLHVLLGNENGHGPSRNQVSVIGNLSNLWAGGASQLFDTAKLRTNGLLAGTTYNDVGPYTWTIEETPPLLGLETTPESTVTAQATRNKLAEQGVEEYTFRVNPDKTCDIGPTTSSTMYRITPLAMVWDGPSSTEGTLATLRAESASYKVDATDFCTYSRFFYGSSYGSTSQGNTFPGGVTNPAPSYYDIGGSNGLRIDCVDGSTSVTSATEAAAQRRINQQEYGLKYDLDVQVESRPDLRNYLRAGDNVDVYLPRMGLIDTANQVVASGRPTSPVRFQCLGLRRPITKGMGVYVIDNFDQAVHDVSDYVIYEDGPTTLDIGKKYARPRTWKFVIQGRVWRKK